MGFPFGFGTKRDEFGDNAQTELKMLERGMSGKHAKILVLGTAHLNQMPKDFNPTALDTLLDRLAVYQPEIITIETESSEECDLAARHPVKYGKNYCPSTAAAYAATGLDVPAALVEANQLLKTWPAQPTPAQRRRLAALFLATNDVASAYVQWLQLPETEHHAGEGLDAALIGILEKAATRNNETYQIAARLAVRLGLSRVYAVDNHTGDHLDIPDVKAFVKCLEAAWNNGEQMREYGKQEDDLKQANDLLPMYRAMNNPEHLRARADGNVGTAMRAKATDAYPQIWVAGWEIRNLRMVANIRETYREHPGARVLCIVGATHKPWFDEWLGQLQGVDIVDVLKVLQ